ncbi:MBL fold metallo-hydrolase [Kytococcus schroeteri]|uniref:MBL fold metallo-hydrolase n=1 Tax=Kytococcus schroeteri TaxID=138300 RepID=UPI0015DD604F|nr:MBL fold metallo-hydrolase [Kytococcus schroeteri]
MSAEHKPSGPAQRVATPRQIEGVRVERVVTAGTFELDGGSWEVENNVWLLGDAEECVVIDPGHDGGPVLDAIGKRTLRAVLHTHAHNDHINATGEVTGDKWSPTYLHPADRMLWDAVYPVAPDHDLEHGQRVTVAGVAMEVLHTPGHSPGAVCFYVPALGILFSGDTLFQGGPGATGRSFSDFGLIIRSITEQLLVLPPDTKVLTGHGDATTIGAEAPHRQEWIDRGH